MSHEPPDDDPVWKAIRERQAAGSNAPFSVVGGDNTLLLRPAPMPDPSSIVPRPWLYGTQLLRGHVSVLVAPGGTGKTGYAMGVALSLASYKKIFGEHIFQRVNVAVVNLEEPLDELNRRLAALMLHHRVDREDIYGRYFFYSADDGGLTVAKLNPDGTDVVHPDTEALIREIRLHDIGLMVVDPFAESHQLEENSNDQIIQAMKAWRRIARVTGCAIWLIHHVRKGAVSDIDAARGAKGMTDSARVGLIMQAMSQADAQEFDISDEDRTSYVRLDDAKANMARKAGVGKWFELVSVELGNGTKDYPTGDRVAALAAWSPPTAMGALSISQCNEGLDLIAEGPREGVRYTNSRSGKTTRWAGQVLVDSFGVGEKRAAAIIATWIKNGVLVVRDYQDPEQRKKTVSGLFVIDIKRPGNEFV